MVKILITAKVEDGTLWESKFRSHAELFKSWGIGSPIYFGVNSNNEVAILEEVASVEAFEENLNSSEADAAMSEDGIIGETFKWWLLDKELSL